MSAWQEKLFNFDRHTVRRELRWDGERNRTKVIDSASHISQSRKRFQSTNPCSRPGWSYTLIQPFLVKQRWKDCSYFNLMTDPTAREFNNFPYKRSTDETCQTGLGTNTLRLSHVKKKITHITDSTPLNAKAWL